MTELFVWLQLHRTVEVVFTRGVEAMMTESGCVQSQHCFLYLYRDSDAQSASWLPLSYMKDVTGLAKAKISVGDLV